MKKIFALVMTIVLLMGTAVSLVSCSSDNLQFGKEYSPLSSQMDVLMQLDTKTIDVGIMDSIMAGYYMNHSSSAYADKLMIVEGIDFEAEQYGIAARKGSGFAKKINMALIELANDGSLEVLAEKYGIASELCIDKNMTVEPLTDSEASDWNYIVGNGEFIVGYTLFAPIAYKDDSGNLIGFDVELAKAVAQKLNLSVQFKEIDWDSKEALLNSKTIDCIWNGLTITEERLENMAVSIPYLNNKQVAIIRVEDKDKYTTLDSMKEAIIGAEEGSAGEECVKAKEE